MGAAFCFVFGKNLRKQHGMDLLGIFFELRFTYDALNLTHSIEEGLSCIPRLGRRVSPHEVTWDIL